MAIMKKREQGKKTMMITSGGIVRKCFLEEVRFYLLLLSCFTDKCTPLINIHDDF